MKEPDKESEKDAKLTEAIRQFNQVRDQLYEDLKIRLKGSSKKNLIRAIADLSLRNDILQEQLAKYELKEKEQNEQQD